MPGKNNEVQFTDVREMAVENRERVEALEKKSDLDSARLELLEKSTASMSSLPATVASLGQRVTDLDKSMIREVDGLREQQKAHKKETTENMERGFKEVGGKVDTLAAEVSQNAQAAGQQSARQKGWWDVLQVVGSCLVGFALILEVFKALHH
jgi:hypothetical protein